jgi:peptidoglycan/xylan/chitin deacetylase (PgdA/CDA1 family)
MMRAGVTASHSASYLTISIDDGHPTDLRTADILGRLGLPGTFYVPGRNPERPVMRPSEIRQLASRGFEIGAHTMNHQRLHRLSDAQARAEIADGKHWLEDVLSAEVVSFCYPGDKYNRNTSAILAELGFRGARTCQLDVHVAPSDPFRWGVSTQAFSHRARVHVLHAMRRRNYKAIAAYCGITGLATDWGVHFERVLDWVERHGGIAHLYVHSWETDDLQEWKKLERVLSSAVERKGLLRVTNGELFTLWHRERSGEAAGCTMPVAKTYGDTQ